MGGSWWWNSWIGSQQNLSWVYSTNERLGWDPMKGSHESRSTHSLGFVFILWFFWNIFLVKLFIFIWNTIDYFFIVKVGAPWQQVKFSISLPHDITVNTHCHVMMGLWSCLDNYVTSQWIGGVAIDTKQSCDKQPESFIQDPGKPGSFTQHPDGGKNHGYFNSKTESSHTSQDKKTKLLLLKMWLVSSDSFKY